MTLKLALTTVVILAKIFLSNVNEMSDAWRYAVWPDPRSSSRALESRRFDHSPFIIGAGKWPILTMDS